MTQIPSERRRFHRFAFDAQTELAQDGKRWAAELVDLSLKGLLIQEPPGFDGDRGKPFTVDLQLAGDTHVSMEVELSHTEHQQLGFVCRHIDIDSISHLRRLIELNLGDEQLLERELSALVEA